MRTRRTKADSTDSPTASTSQSTRSTEFDTSVPRIVKSTLLKPHRWFVVTKYVIKRATAATGPNAGATGTYLVAKEKFDVTDQMTSILKAHRR